MEKYFVLIYFEVDRINMVYYDMIINVRHFGSTLMTDFVDLMLHLQNQTWISYKVDRRNDIKINDYYIQTTPNFGGAALSTEESLRWL